MILENTGVGAVLEMFFELHSLNRDDPYIRFVAGFGMLFRSVNIGFSSGGFRGRSKRARRPVREPCRYSASRCRRIRPAGRRVPAVQRRSDSPWPLCQ